MKRQVNETTESLRGEDASELEASLSADLGLTETASNEIKAGGVQTGNVFTVTFGGTLAGIHKADDVTLKRGVIG